MSPRTGRPKAENPKKEQIGARLDVETVRKLDKTVDLTNSTRSEVIRHGIDMAYDEATKPQNRRTRNAQQATRILPTPRETE